MGKMMDRPTIIITGASSGLGAAATYQAARMGASVVLAARSLENLQTQARKIEQAGGQ
ncbi:MAG: SDR family NAD(P)-dependent oxidoreductase, partial [Chloroflexota bacterium]